MGEGKGEGEKTTFPLPFIPPTRGGKREFLTGLRKKLRSP
jgi:hypothetical protein